MTPHTSPIPVVKSGEQPLSVFVSSVMGADMQWAWDAVGATLDRAPYLSRWLFEYTPASSDAADNRYLSKVREAAVVIGIKGWVKKRKRAQRKREQHEKRRDYRSECGQRRYEWGLRDQSVTLTPKRKSSWNTFPTLAKPRSRPSFRMPRRRRTRIDATFFIQQDP